MSDTSTSSNTESAKQIEQLVASLSNDDGLKRQDARRRLVHIGSPAVPSLISALKDKKHRVRWEAAKALVSIRDPQAAPALVEALMDENFEIQWLAAEGLIELGHDAVKALLEALMLHYESVYLRQGAHHVLYELEREKLLNEQETAVIDELRSIEPSHPFPAVARTALAAMTRGSNG
jgi:HEAT repeat protein